MSNPTRFFRNRDQDAQRLEELTDTLKATLAELTALPEFMEGVAPILKSHEGVQAAARLAQEVSASATVGDQTNAHLGEVQRLLERVASATEASLHRVVVPAAKELHALKAILGDVLEEQRGAHVAALQSDAKLSTVVAALAGRNAKKLTHPTPRN